MAFETIIQVVQAIIGFALIFFVPGYLVMNKFYNKVKGVERIALIIGISISIAILLGLILGLLGIFNVWTSFAAYAIIITIILLVKK